MVLDIPRQIKKILNEKNHDLKHHYWLEGFHLLNEDALLNTSSVNQFLEHKCKEFPPFTELYSGSVYSQYRMEFTNNLMRSIHLPFEDNKHLLFYLRTDDYKEKILYTDCGPYCRVLAPYRFPLIELRRSQDFSKNPEIMESIRRGDWYYDPTILFKSLNPDSITQTFVAVKDFIEYSRT